MTEWQQRLTRRLEAARGDRPVDLLFRGGKVVNVFTGELSPETVAVFDGVVVGFGEREANEIVELAFGLSLGAVAVAVALSFGLGGREAAGKLMEHWLSRWRGGGGG